MVDWYILTDIVNIISGEQMKNEDIKVRKVKWIPNPGGIK
jgi:hypothetical protein